MPHNCILSKIVWKNKEDNVTTIIKPTFKTFSPPQKNVKGETSFIACFQREVITESRGNEYPRFLISRNLYMCIIKN